MIFNMSTSANASTIEKKKTRVNYESEILEARVIANYGDPGLDEDYHFDILSRYVLVMLESYQRVLTSDKQNSMLALVKRPTSLWIDYVGATAASNPTSQQRTDRDGNVSIGLAGSFSTNGISRISPAYTFGESIKIRKMAYPIQSNDSFFLSAFSRWDATTWSYGGWHSEGSTLPYFTNDDMKASLRKKTITPVADGSAYYMGYLHKYQYEAFILSLSQGNSQVAEAITTIFNGSWGGNPAVYTAKGGYVFSNRDFVLLNSVGFEDINVGGKARVADNECVPLVVTTPNSFPVPSQRAIGTIQYNPTYSPIAR